MKKSEIKRFTGLYEHHLKLLKLQGKSDSAISAYSRNGGGTSTALNPTILTTFLSGICIPKLVIKEDANGRKKKSTQTIGEGFSCTILGQIKTSRTVYAKEKPQISS